MTAPGLSSQELELSALRQRIISLERELAKREPVHGALEESRALFQAFLSNLPLYAWIKDRAGRYIYANPLMQQLLGAKGVSWCGLTDAELWAPDDAPDLDREIGSITVDGQAHTWAIRRFPFLSRSGERYIAALAEDITEKVRLEQELRTRSQAEHSAKAQALSILDGLRQSEIRVQRMFHSELAGMMECEGEMIVDVNDTLLSWLGLSREALNSHPLKWSDLTPPRFQFMDDECRNKLRSGRNCAAYDTEICSSDGRSIPVTVHVSVLDPKTESFLAVILNQSDSRDMQSRLLRSQKLESLGLIAGGVAHDFNNLLATIMGNASMSLDSMTPDHPAYHTLNEVMIATRRASELTQQVLAYSGRANFAIRTIDLSKMVMEIGSLLETTISKKLRLTYDLAGNLPGLEGDEGQVQQVIMNLVINASDAIGENPGEIHIATYRTGPTGKGCVCFEVRDTGCGMSEETQKRIFDPFFTTKTNGRGLGLAAVLGVVKNHGGRLTVDSVVGKGTTFRAYFPESHCAKSEKRERANANLGGTETILVADDDEGIRRMTRSSLERFGYKVLLARDGAEAVEAYKANAELIDVVLLDWAMPVMNGEEALRQILASNPEAKVLLSSGYAETETMQRIGAGALAGFLQKPYTTTQLASCLREVLGVAKRV